MGLFKNIGKGKVKSKINKIIDNAKKDIKKFGGNVKFAPLVIFMPLMENELKKRGLNYTKGNLESISRTFLSEVVKKMDGKHFTDVQGLNDENYNLAMEAAESVVSMIIAFIKKIKEKKASGQELSADEQKILDVAEKTTDVVVGAGKDAAESAISDKIKDFVFSWKGAVLALAIGALVYYAYSKRGN